MKQKLILFTGLLGIVTISTGQPRSLIIPSNVKLPKDSGVAVDLIKALNGFLNAKERPNEENSFVLKDQLVETSALLDEIKEIEKNNKLKDTNFYKCYLSNILRLDSTNYLIQFSYIGINENIPLLRASFKVLAKREGGNFFVYSPLKRNTASWKKQKFGNTMMYYQNSFNRSKAKKYFKTVEAFDKKLKAISASEIFYSCSNFNEALQVLGIDYKSDYNGRTLGALNEAEKGKVIRIDGGLRSGFTDFDPHDLWHSRLHNVLSVSVINKPVDEGTAYLYGGSWGLSWNTILERFMVYAKNNQNADWLALYNESKNFDEKEKYPLNVDYVINALLVREIEKEKGFPAVMELLNCGKREDGNENYFLALEKITGINKRNFNEKVSELIKGKLLF